MMHSLEENAVIPCGDLFEFTAYHFPYIVAQSRLTDHDAIMAKLYEEFGDPLEFTDAGARVLSFRVTKTAALWAYLNKGYAKPHGAFFFKDGFDAVLIKLMV